ncbi:hypothetical protein AAG570_003800 [Ranatra chinensis]|uniref:AB hydrolase-1 domain-containing protein n=1 Tax=Ranatra chinensis TaxID=642074 RepID=A0ABD0Y4N9_9HEMI
MVHGLLHNACSFRALVTLLPPHFYYVCIDLPGHGWSSPFPPGVPLDFFQYVFSIKRFIDAIGWSKFVLIGHSFGCMTGTMFTALYPEMVDKYIAIDGFVPFIITNAECPQLIRKSFDRLLELERNLEVSGRRSLTQKQALDKIMSGPNGEITSEEVALALLRRSAREEPGGTFTFTDDPRLRFKVGSLLSRAQLIAFMRPLASVPTMLLLAATTFVLINDSSKKLASKSPISRTRESLLEVVKLFGSGRLVQVAGNHFVHINDPQSVADHINQFLLEPRSSL